jgi:DNA-binding phage protein
MQHKADALAQMRSQVEETIKRFKSVEDFCWQRGLNKATVSNFLRGKKDFQLSTLLKIAKATRMTLKIRLE